MIWRRTQPPAFASQHARGKATDTLELHELRSDYTWLYIDVEHRASEPDAPRDGGHAEIFVRKNGCPILPPNISGTVWRNSGTRSRLTTALTSLPDGELAITIRALGTNSDFTLQKRGRSLRHLTLAERATYREFPADPKNNLPARIVVQDEFDCRPEVAL